MTPPRRTPSLALVACCLLFSGAASLSLEVVWSRLLKLVFGSTTLAITTILVAYMLGLGIGGLLGGRVADRLRNGVRAYGWMECAIGLYALCVPWLLGSYPEVNRALLADLGFWPAAFARFGLVTVVLLLPTICMGATLPVLVAALTRDSEELAARVGLLYGANTLGAVLGVVGATFVGFGALGVRGTNTAAALVGVAVGAVTLFVLAPGRDAEPREAPPARARRRDPLLWSYTLVGFAALVFEVAWTRALSMVLGSSIYAFATMLAGFLAGIALGSLLARRRIDRLARPVEAYGFGVGLLGVGALLTVLSFRALPDVFLSLIDRFGISGTLFVGFGVALAAAVMLLPTLVLGALFPLVVRAVARERGEEGGTVGDVYFVNTIGSAAGAFAAGFLLVPHLGLRWTMGGALALVFALSAAVLFFARAERGPFARHVGALVALVAVVLAVRPPAWDAAELSAGVYYRPESRLDFGIESPPLIGVTEDEMLFYEEGINTTVSVHRMDVGISLRINGKADASLADMSTQLLSGHIPMLFGGPGPGAKVLVIGYASGVTTGAVTLHDPERVDVAEIEPAIIEASRWFDDVNHRPLERDDVRLILDDGRTWLATTDERYDVIISEPSNPWMTGCSNLFTSEFFASVKQRLAPGGRLLQWIQLYGLRPEAIQSILAALHEHFDHAYGFLDSAESADLLLLATDEPLVLTDLPDWAALDPAVRADLESIGNDSTADLWTLLALTPDGAAELGRRAPVVNTDDSMYVELNAPLQLYEQAWDNLDLVGSVAAGCLPVAEGERPLPALVVGELGVTYLLRRRNPELAERVVAAARERGDVSHDRTFEAVRLRLDDNPDYARLLELLEEALQAQPYAFVPRFQRAEVLYETGNFEAALVECRNALRSRPGHLAVRRLRLNLLAAMRRWKEARTLANELLATTLGVREPQLWAEAAIIESQLGEVEPAAAKLAHFLEWSPYSPQEWARYAELLTALGREGEAEVATTNTERAFRAQVALVHRAARWHERFGDRDDAVDSLRFVLRLDPDNVEARADLARVTSRRADG
jgi:spermidine synthase